MPLTYQLIQSTTLASPVSQVTFSSIPQTFTDLILRCSIRSNTSASSTEAWVNRFNGNANMIYYDQQFNVAGTNPTGNLNTGTDFILGGFIDANNSAVSTFSNMEVTLYNYAETNQTGQVVSSNSVGPAANPRNINWVAGFVSGVVGINSFRIQDRNSAWVTGTTFHLYGVKRN